MLDETTDSRSQTEARRSPVVAFLLSSLTPGLGQMYNGQPRKALLFFLGASALPWFLIYSVFLSMLGYAGFIVSLALIAGYNLLIMAEAAATAARLKKIRVARYHQFFIYVLIFIANSWIMVHVHQSFKEALQAGTAPCRSFYIPSSAMVHTLEIGDYILTDCRKPYLPRRGDIIVFKPPPAAEAGGKDYIKRVIGLPGETVAIEGDRVKINGVALPEPYTYLAGQSWAGREFGPITVRPGRLFVLGDNRHNSQDSRYWGQLPVENIVGKALYVFWSSDHGRIGRSLEPVPQEATPRL